MMFQFLLACHSVLRWLILAGLLYTSVKALQGIITRGVPSDLLLKVAKTTQLLIMVATLMGILMYTDSPSVQKFLHSEVPVTKSQEIRFFGWIHPAAMLLLPILTSAAMWMLKYSRTSDYSLYILMRYFGVSFMLAMVSIPWPVFDMVHRPLLRF